MLSKDTITLQQMYEYVLNALKYCWRPFFAWISFKTLKGENRPINPLQNRMTMLAALECVDWVVPFTEETPERLYCRVLPDVIVKGGDYTEDQVAGGKCIKANGGSIEILSFVDGQSTSNIINKIKG